MAATALVGGVTEAAFLVVLTRAAFAITKGQKSIGTIAGVHLSVASTVLVALVLVLLRIAMAVVSNIISASLNAEVTRSLRSRLARAFLRSSWPAQQAGRAGQLQELVTSYSNSGSSLVASFAAGVVAAFNLLAMLTLALGVDTYGSLITIGALGVLGIALRPLRRRVQIEARLFADDAMRLALATNEVSGLGMVVHTFDVREAVGDRVADLLAAGADSNRRLTSVRGLVPAIYTGLAYLALVGAIGLASAWDTTALTSLGAVMLVMLRSLSYGQQLQTAYGNVASSIPQVADIFSEIERYEANEYVDHGDPVLGVCPLALEDVSFEYVPHQRVLTGINAVIRPREMVGIVGPSGSGKSTLVQLLLGLRQPTEGTVLAAGADIRTLRHSQWARLVTFVPQTPALISGTIADNVRFYRSDISEEQVHEAVRLAGLEEEVLAFRDAYDHQVGDRGGNLSGGQQQRLCIARALVGSPEVLILDEPTSALDAVTETRVRATLNSLKSKMTIIVIAHRLSTLDQCDRIMVIEDGRMPAFDTPENLRLANNFFTEALRHSGLS